MTVSSITNTEWPVLPIPGPVKQLLNAFFTIVDTRSADIGQRLCDEVFTPNSDFIANKKVCKGHKEIARSRDGTWDGVASRHHELVKVYTCNDAADDLMLIGFVEIGYNNGTKVDGSFVVRAVVDDVKSQSPRLTLYQGWMDSTEMVAAKKQQQG